MVYSICSNLIVRYIYLSISRRGMCYTNCEDWNTKRSIRSYLINEARFAKGLVSLNDQDVLLMSDYDEDFWDSAEDEEGSSTSDQWDGDDEVRHSYYSFTCHSKCSKLLLMHVIEL